MMTPPAHDTVVMPIHDDAAVLPFSLRCLQSFTGEVIFILDHPTPASEALVRAFASRHPNCRLLPKTRLPFPCRSPAQSSYICGSLHATGRRVFWVGPDIVFPPAIFHAAPPLPCDFPYIQAHTHLARAYFTLLAHASPQHCLQVFPRGFPFHQYNWYDGDAAYATPQAVGVRYTHLHSPTILHLRSFTHHPTREYARGLQRRQRQHSLARVLAGSLLFLKLRLIIGYLWQWRRDARGG